MLTEQRQKQNVRYLLKTVIVIYCVCIFQLLSASNYFQTEKDSAISDCTKAIELNSNYVKAYVRRAQLYEETNKLDEALEDFKKVLTFDPNHTEANHAIRVMYYLLKKYRYLKYYL